MLEVKDEQLLKSEPSSFDDLNSVLNFEAKEFTDLVSTLDKVLTQKKPENSAPIIPPAAATIQPEISAKD